MYLDFKITTWERLYVPEDLQQEIKEQLENGNLQTANDVIHKYEHKGVYMEGYISETDETMSVDDNDGQPTIELLNDDGEEPIFKNA